MFWGTTGPLSQQTLIHVFRGLVDKYNVSFRCLSTLTLWLMFSLLCFKDFRFTIWVSFPQMPLCFLNASSINLNDKPSNYLGPVMVFDVGYVHSLVLDCDRNLKDEPSMLANRVLGNELLTTHTFSVNHPILWRSYFNNLTISTRVRNLVICLMIIILLSWDHVHIIKNPH